MDVDFKTFKGSTTDDRRRDTVEPPDGVHTALLAAAKLGASRNGDRLIICEWQTEDLRYYWTSFHGLGEKAWPFTRRLLTSLGVDFDALESWDDLAGVVDSLGGDWLVKTTHNGDWLNLEVLEGRTQPELPAVVPPELDNPAFDDDDIPF